MVNPHTYFESLRERFQAMIHQPCIPRTPHEKGGSTYFVAAPIFTTEGSGPLFVPLDVIWERLHDRHRELKNPQLEAAELLDVSRLQLCMIEEAFDRDDDGRLCATTEGRLFKYCKIDPTPPFHDYDVLDAYTWEKPNLHSQGASFAIYEADCFLYWVLKSPLTYRLFFPHLAECITQSCGYTGEEAHRFFKDMTRFHHTLLARTATQIHQ